MAKTSYYDILGIDKKADKDEIKRAYRKLALKYHPDMNIENKNTEAAFIIINTAYEILLDEETRKEYDKYIDRALSQNTIIINISKKYHPIISKTIDEFNYVLWDFEEIIKRIEDKLSILVGEIKLYDFVLLMLKYLENEILKENDRYKTVSAKKERIMLYLSNYFYLLRIETNKYIEKMNPENNDEIKKMLEIKTTLIKNINEIQKYI